MQRYEKNLNININIDFVGLIQHCPHSIPRHKASELAYKHKDCCRQKFRAVEAECYGYDIANDGHPREYGCPQWPSRL